MRHQSWIIYSWKLNVLKMGPGHPATIPVQSDLLSRSAFERGSNRWNQRSDRYPLTRMIFNERNVSKPNPFPFFFPPLLDPATAHFPIPSCYRRCSFPALPQAQRWGLHVDDSPLPDPTPRSHPPPSLIFSSLLAVIISAAPPPAVAFVTAASSSFSGLY